MFNYKMKIQYDGSRYSGWQKQGNTGNTIQKKFEDILYKLAGYEVEIHGSGRTDAGVHANGQVANFKLREDYGTDVLIEYINKYLPDDINVLSIERVDEKFHARLNASKKRYIYRIDNGQKQNVFTRKYTFHCPEKLDIDAMRKAADIYVGEHDFKAFCDNKHMKKSTVRTVYKVNIVRDENELIICYEGNGFLYHMVRLMTGALIDVGLHKMSCSELCDTLENKDRGRLNNLAPAQGLILDKVWY